MRFFFSYGIQVLQHRLKKPIFVSASHQTGLDIRLMTRRSIIVGIRGGGGRVGAEARALLDYAGHRPTMQCGPDKPSWTWTQNWVQARMPDYSLNWTARSSAIQEWQRCQWCSELIRRWHSRSWRPFGLKSAMEHWSSGTDARQFAEKPLRQAQWLIKLHRWKKRVNRLKISLIRSHSMRDIFVSLWTFQLTLIQTLKILENL